MKGKRKNKGGILMAYNNNPQLNQYQMQMSGGYRQAQTPQYPNWNTNQVSTPTIRPVTSLEEVRAYPIDFDGSIFYFTDIANKRIYTKQIGMDGSAIINLYEQKELQQPVAVSVNDNYVTKEEFEQTIRQLIEKYEKILKVDSSEQTKKPLFEI